MLLADVIASWLLMSDVVSHCGRCKSHIIYLCKPTIVGFLWQMLLPHCKADVFAIVVDGITTFVWADVLSNYANWNSYIVTAFNWLICGRWNSHCFIVTG